MVTAAAPVLPDDPREGVVGHLLLADPSTGLWWRVHLDGTRTRIGDTAAAEALVRGWLAWTSGAEIPGVGWVHGEYVGDRYTVRRLRDPAELARWSDVTPGRVLR